MSLAAGAAVRARSRRRPTPSSSSSPPDGATRGACGASASATRARDGSGTRSRVVLQAPGGKSGLYLFEVRTANRTVQVPFAVQSVREERVLVVLPVTTWQGLNKVDDDGDGWPDTLEDGLPVRTARPYAGGVLPAGVAEHVGAAARGDRSCRAALRHHDRRRARPRPGPEARAATPASCSRATRRWMDGGVQRVAARAGCATAGALLQTGTGSLRRSVAGDADAASCRPTQPTPRDLFGARLGQRRPRRPGVTLTNTVDRIDLFRGTDGQLGPFDAYEATSSVGADAAILAVASTPDAQHDVLVASRFGRRRRRAARRPRLLVRLSTRPGARARS